MRVVLVVLTAAVLHVLSADQNISAEPGQNINLPCRSKDSRPVVVVEWSRTDLGSELVLLFRDDQIHSTGQHPLYKDRVDLHDRQIKEGNVSLVLNNVTTEDSGTYVCRVDYSKPNRSRRGHEEHGYINKYYLHVSPPDQNLTAEPGQNINLPCRSKDSRAVVVIEWSRTDLRSDYVLLFRDDQIDPEGQHPSYQNRVDLQNRQMKDGDVSLMLNNVNINDTGTYVCQLQVAGSREKMKISTVHLEVSPPGQIISAEPGQNIILPCRSKDSRPVVVVQWSRTDLGSGHVLLFRDDRIDPHFQHPSYKNRVDLQDRQMKDGDVSLMLNNVTTEDSGTYECRVAFSQSKRRKRAVLTSEPIRTIQLQVSPPGDKRGQGDKEERGNKEGRQNHGGDKDRQGPDGEDQDGTSSGPSGLVVTLIVLTVIVVLMIPVVIIIIVKRRLPHHPPHNEKKPPLLPNIHFSYKEALKHACPLSVAT